MKHAFSKIISFVIFLLAYVLCTFVKEPLTIVVVKKDGRYAVKVSKDSTDPECGLESKEVANGNTQSDSGGSE